MNKKTRLELDNLVWNMNYIANALEEAAKQDCGIDEYSLRMLRVETVALASLLKMDADRLNAKTKKNPLTAIIDFLKTC